MPQLAYPEARIAVQRLGITTTREYYQRYTEQPGLPSTPQKAYPEWRGWADFLPPRSSSPRQRQFLPLAEAMTAVKPLGIQDQYEYRRRYREQPGLHSNPERFYADWPGWSVYLGKGDVKKSRIKKPSLPELQALVRELGLHTRQAYRQAAHSDPRLSLHPNERRGWPGWSAFLGVENAGERWLPYAEARALVHAQGWSDVHTYHARYREVPGLPYSPEDQYSEWQGWTAFLKPWVLPYVEASRAARAAGFRTVRAYHAGYKVHEGLPADPVRMYKDEWQGWVAFLGPVPSKFLAYTEARACAQAAGWLTSYMYRSRYHTIPGLPCMPEKMYRTEWQGWAAFLGDRRL